MKISAQNKKANDLALRIVVGILILSVLVGGYFVVQAIQSAFVDACVQLGTLCAQ